MEPNTAADTGWGLRTREREVDGVAVLDVGGTVDMAAAPVLADQVGAILRRRPSVFVVDLSGVTFLTTAGIGVLVQAHYKCIDSGTSFRVVASGPATARPMQLLGIDDVLDLHATVDTAVAAHRSE